MTQLFLHTVAVLKTGNAAINPYGAKGADEGKILFIDEDGKNIDITADTISAPFRIVQVTGTDEPILQTQTINPKDIVKYNVSLATAGAKQVTAIGDTGETNISTALPTDSIVSLKLFRTDLGYNPDEFESYEVPASADPAAALKALIDDRSKIVDATRNTATDLDLTGKTVDVSFETVLVDGAGDRLDDTFEVTQDPVRNVGNLDFLRNIQEYSQASYGFFNRKYLPLTPKDYVKDPADLAIDLNAGNLANGYDIVTLQVKFGDGTTIGPDTTEIYLAFPADYDTPADSVLAANSVSLSTLLG